MNWICVFLFNLLWVNSCLMANIDREPSHEVQQLNSTQNVTEASSFNEDFQYAVFDSSELLQTVSLAKDPKLTEFVKTVVFPAKYHNYNFYLILSNREEEEIFERGLNVRGYNFSSDVIEYFGELIETLYIYSAESISDEQSEAFMRQMNDHCADSLTYLYIGGMKENALSQFQKPFSKITEAFIYFDSKQTEPIRPIGEIFPKLEKLTFKILNSALDNEANKFLESEMPSLKELEFSVLARGDPLRIASVHQQIGNMFKTNSQIQKLTYTRGTEEFIDIINEHLVNLEHFVLSTPISYNRSMHFDHVKYFSVLVSSEDMTIDNVTFSQLDTLDMFYSSYFAEGIERDSWIRFYKNHQYLKNFNFTIYKSEGLNEFLAELPPNLETIRFKSYVNIDIDAISRLIDDHEHLLTFDYKIRSTDQHPAEFDLSNYLDKFGNDWHITHSIEEEWISLVFQKKN